MKTIPPMRAKTPLTDRDKTLRDFARLCEYMYRKGIMDAAEMYNPSLVKQFLDENDPKYDLRFMFDEDGRKMKPDLFAAMMSVWLIKLNARKGAIILDKSRVDMKLRNGSVYLSNAYYRKGLLHGISLSPTEAKDFYYADENFKQHQLITGEKFSLIDFIQDMQYEALKLDKENNEEGYRIWRFISDALNEYYAKRGIFNEF